MSDMYLELLTRIPVVTNWVPIGSARLQEAQNARGLSNERLAREIPVAAKTWERWKKRGAVPADSIPAVARALHIEIRHSGPTDIELDAPTPTDQPHLENLLGQVAKTNQRVIELLEAVLAQQPPQARPEAASERRG